MLPTSPMSWELSAPPLITRKGKKKKEKNWFLWSCDQLLKNINPPKQPQPLGQQQHHRLQLPAPAQCHWSSGQHHWVGSWGKLNLLKTRYSTWLIFNVFISLFSPNAAGPPALTPTLPPPSWTSSSGATRTTSVLLVSIVCVCWFFRKRDFF